MKNKIFTKQNNKNKLSIIKTKQDIKTEIQQIKNKVINLTDILKNINDKRKQLENIVQIQESKIVNINQNIYITNLNTLSIRLNKVEANITDINNN